VAYDSFPNNAHNNRAISLAEQEQLLAPHGFSGLIGFTGVTPVYANSTGLHAKLRAGVAAAVRGTRFNNATETIVALGANTSGSPRIDLIVLRLNRAATAPNAFTVTPVVVAGTPAAVPLAPQPVRNNTLDGTGVWDIPVAEADVPHGAASIPSTAVRNRAWWLTGSGYTGFDAVRPPVEPGVFFRANDSGVTYVGTSGGTWQRVYYNTGWSSLPIPAGAGWSGQAFHFNRCGDLVVMNARLIRTGATMPATASAVFGTLSDIFRPTMAMSGTYHCTLPDHSGHVGVSTGGTITFVGTNTTAQNIQNGATLISNMVWPAAA
jgi:hypothetical protein